MTVISRQKDFSSLNPDLEKLNAFWKENKNLYRQRLEEIQKGNLDGKGLITEDKAKIEAFSLPLSPNLCLEYKNSLGCNYYLCIYMDHEQKGVQIFSCVDRYNDDVFEKFVRFEENDKETTQNIINDIRLQIDINRCDRLEKKISTCIQRILYGQELVEILNKDNQKAPISYPFSNLIISNLLIFFGFVEKPLFAWIMPDNCEEPDKKIEKAMNTATKKLDQEKKDRGIPNRNTAKPSKSNEYLNSPYRRLRHYVAKYELEFTRLLERYRQLQQSTNSPKTQCETNYECLITNALT